MKIESGMVKVRAKKSTLQSSKRTPEHVGRDLTNFQTFVVIGGGKITFFLHPNLQSLPKVP